TEVDVEENKDLRAPLVTLNTPMRSDNEEVSTPRGWYDVDQGTGLSDVDEETELTTVEAYIVVSKECFNRFLQTDLEPEILLSRRGR
ncbi:hypothetical protein, partial [Pseudomonas aeruginosa]|uniref:hypothetical protein n=1 Tax=Pseudomonas aeruginosa TaxID=287 RepID=UPI002E8E78A4|nr:hypothetical protein [Pseudomonas aeruginosa]